MSIQEVIGGPVICPMCGEAFNYATGSHVCQSNKARMSIQRYILTQFGEMKPVTEQSPTFDSGWVKNADYERELAAKDAEIERLKTPRMFPVQNRLYRDEEGKTKPGPPQIPWEIAEKVYAAYSARYGTEQSLEHLGKRGGFGLAEMDMLYPKWREEVDELVRLRSENVSLKVQVERLSAWQTSVLRRRGLSDAPCDVCGYNGVGYYQPSTHPCAGRAAKEKP